jgi:hypothetical protein
MPSPDLHPSVLRHRARAAGRPPAPAMLDAGWLRQLCLDAGADDVGFVEIGRAELAAEREHILAAFPRTRTLRVKNGLRPATVRRFLRGLPIAFQPEQAGDLAATYHFEFTGDEAGAATVVIRDRTIQVRSGLEGTADLLLAFGRCFPS